MITLSQLQRVMPHSGPRAALFLDALNGTFVEYEILTAKRQAAFLAQIAVESGELWHLKELGTDEYFRQRYEGRRDLGNTQPGDGVRFPGRGLIQITGRANYELCGIALKLDLITHPELLEQVEPAARSAGWFWQTHQLNALADRNAFFEITHRINGGYNQGDERLGYYLLWRSLLGVL